MPYIPDNYDLFEKHDAEQERKLRTLPKCSCCGERIQQEKAVFYNEKWFCEDCEDEFLEQVRKDYLERVDI